MYRLKQLSLLLSDLVAFGLGFLLALGIRNYEIPSPHLIEQHTNLFVLLFVIWAVVNYINSLYDLGYIRHRQWYRRIAEAGLIALIVSIVILYLHPQRALTPKTILLLNIFLGYGISVLFRIAYQYLVGHEKVHTKVIMVGFSDEIRELIELIERHPEKGYQVSAICDPEGRLKDKRFDGIAIYRSIQTLRPAITNHKAQLIVAAPHLKERPEILREMYELLFWPVEITDYAKLYETITGRLSESIFSESWFLANLKNQQQPVYSKFRRLVDYILGILLGLFFVILFPVIALMIKLASPGPILFTQKRIGQYGDEFKIYKFRTMYALAPDGSAEEAGAQFAIKGDKRVTSVGKFLRKMRLDEIPQFINLLKGELTFIGPRAERPEIVNQLTERMPYYPLRHTVKPGITGWALLHQGYTDTIERSLQKLQYDLYYIKNRSFLLDLSIMLRTINTIIRLKGQ